MISTKTSSLFPKQGDQNAKRTEETHRQEQGKTKYEAPRNVNYRATQNKNIETTAVERLVVYTTGGLSAFLSLYKLHPGSRYNSEYKKYIKKFGSHNGFLAQSMHLSENTK